MVVYLLWCLSCACLAPGEVTARRSCIFLEYTRVAVAAALTSFLSSVIGYQAVIRYTKGNE
jgi:hypothetical protein